MAGVPSATLTGWAIPVQGLPAAEHTYVTSSCGLIWHCWGASSGGTSVTSGVGNSAIAHCLSRPASTAGLRYALDGFCHQATNRILHPAQPKASVVHLPSFAATQFWGE